MTTKFHAAQAKPRAKYDKPYRWGGELRANDGDTIAMKFYSISPAGFTTEVSITAYATHIDDLIDCLIDVLEEARKLNTI